MEELKNPTLAAKSWTDEIDDLYQAAMETNLRALLETRARRLVPDFKRADGPVPEAVQGERETPFQAVTTP